MDLTIDELIKPEVPYKTFKLHVESMTRAEGHTEVNTKFIAEKDELIHYLKLFSAAWKSSHSTNYNLLDDHFSTFPQIVKVFQSPIESYTELVKYDVDRIEARLSLLRSVWVTYFDEKGQEHNVKIKLDDSRVVDYLDQHRS